MEPNPGPQTRFLASRADELLFGGAAGGGKSYGLLLWALRWIDHPEYRGLLLRRTYPELVMSLIDESKRLYPTLRGQRATYNESRHTWTFRSGAQITFGSCEHERDVHRYQSAQFARIGFDQVESFTSYQYTYLLSRLRNVAGIPNQIRATANPGGSGGAWVKRRWIDKLSPNVRRWFLSDHEVARGTPNALSRQWIPSLVTDNPHLMETDPGYVARLMAMPDRERRQLLEGDWDASSEGLVYDEFRTELHVVDAFDPPAEWTRFRAIDFGYNNPFVCLWGALSPDDELYIYRELYETEQLVSDLGPRIRDLSKEDHIQYTVADHDAENRAELNRHSVRTIPAQKAIQDGIQEVRKRLHRDARGRARLYIMRDCTVRIDGRLRLDNKPLNTQEEFGVYSRAPETERRGLDEEPLDRDNHGMDALRYMCMSLRRQPRPRSRVAQGV